MKSTNPKLITFRGAARSESWRLTLNFVKSCFRVHGCSCAIRACSQISVCPPPPPLPTCWLSWATGSGNAMRMHACTAKIHTTTASKPISSFDKCCFCVQPTQGNQAIHPNVAQLKSDASGSSLLSQASCPTGSLKATKAARMEACTMPKMASGPPAQAPQALHAAKLKIKPFYC